jgi:hypothetical protein
LHEEKSIKAVIIIKTEFFIGFLLKAI